MLDHIDVIDGMVTGKRTPGAPDYSGEWPRDWLSIDSAGNVTVKQDLSSVPDAAKNDTADVIKTFNKATWQTVKLAPEFKSMTFRINDVGASQYIRLRGTNLPPGVPYETDANGNPLTDLWTNAAAVAYVSTTTPPPVPPATSQAPEFPANYFLRIPCTTAGTTEFDGCPSHLGTRDGQKYSSFDVAAWSDLWFYSNPIFIEVSGSVQIASVD